MLILARKVDEQIIIGDDIVISIVDIKGDQVKLGIQAPQNVKVYRHEVYEAIQKENRAAVRTATELPKIEKLVGKRKIPKSAAPPASEAKAPGGGA